MPEEEKEGGKGRVVRIRIQTLAAASFLALAAIGISYLAGVMSGRQSFSAQISAPAPGPAQKAAPGTGKLGDGAEKAEEPILEAKDLKFAKALRNEENSPLARLKAQPEKSAPPQAAEPQPAKEEAPPRPSLKESLAAEKSGATEDYLFQVGAFKDEKAVDALRERLEGHGLRTLMQREGKLYLVCVRLRGTSERAAELAGLFVELGLGEPLLRSRSAVKP